MVPTHSPFLPRHNPQHLDQVLRLSRVAACLLMWGAATVGWAQDLVFSARVDKTSVDVGSPISLTLTLSGDLVGVELPQVEFPDGWSVAARSQATNFSVRAGATERSVSLVYVIVPQQAGTFRLGPFAVTHHKKSLQTEPIEIIVKKSVLPPSTITRQGERFTL